MTETITIKRSTVDRTVGSIWCVDHEQGFAYQVMGSGRPPLYMGEVYRDVLEASAAWPGDYRTKWLPDDIGVPAMTPFPVAGAPALSTVSTAVYLVRFDSLLSAGLQVERAPLDAVDYAPPPFHMEGDVHFVATAAYITAGARYRIRIAHTPEGRPHVADIHEISAETGVHKPSAIYAFLCEADAVAAADKLARRLIEAADWRSNSSIERASFDGMALRNWLADAQGLPSLGR